MSDVYDLLSPDESKDYIRVKQATKQGYILCENGGVADLSYPNSKLRRGRVQGGKPVPLSPQVIATYTELKGMIV
jgi:hypothetical protein